MKQFSTLIAQKLNLSAHSVEATLSLIDEGCTIPFISRYRKERTGNLNEVQITNIAELSSKLEELNKRKETILKTIREQGKLTTELETKIGNCWESAELEDLYLPFKPKRRTRAQIAREQGLEPLATIIYLQREANIKDVAKRYTNNEVKDVEKAISGAQDIIAEMVAEDAQARNLVRRSYQRQAVISSKVIKKKENDEDAQKFSDYFDFSEPLRKCSSHRLLALRRGESAGVLKVSISIDDEACIARLQQQFVHGKGTCQTLVAEAVADAYKRLLDPSLENEFATLSKQQADDEAIKVFTDNLRQLLLSAPLGQKRVLALDPGFANGCKIACLDEQGNLLHHEIIYPHPPRQMMDKAAKRLNVMIKTFHIEAIAIGNGTASRETKTFVEQWIEDKSLPVFVVSEDGASIYSASATAREEFPNEDVTTRGAVSIGRRLMDPLAELVKIDPKSIGVGQYQHDVDQSKLKQSLDQTVVSCVNQVGINLNTASKHLLMYVSGLGSTLAQNIVDYRRDNGPFMARTQLKKVKRLGENAFMQCAGFLRISNGKNPLDNTAVHPESYHIVEQMAKDNHCAVSELILSHDLQRQIDLKKYVTDVIGLPTLNDIMKELEKPGRDPRGAVEVFEFDKNVQTVDDLLVGMDLPGIVTNITNFGAFVDIGVHQDGLVHISQLADHYVSIPSDVVKLHQHVRVKVLEVDYKRKRISLTMKGIRQ